MKWFTELVGSLSAVLVILSVIWILVPKGKMEHSLRFAVGVFVLGALISLFSTAFSRDEKERATLGSSFSYQEKADAIVLKNTEYAIGKLLENESIFYNEISLFTDNSQVESIHITKVEVDLCHPEDFSRAAQLLKKETGLELVGG